MSSYSAEVLADSPIAYWRLGDASGPTAADSASGGANPGTYNGGFTLGQGGAPQSDPDTAALFNGSTGYVEVPFAAALNPASFSVECWAYVTGGAGGFRAVVSARDIVATNTRGFILYASDVNKWEFWIGTGTAAWTGLVGPAVVLNSWNHLVGTYDGTSSRFYVNGVLVAGPTASAFVANAARPLRIAAGQNEGAANFFVPGTEDEVAVYNTVLSLTRIQAHYTTAVFPVAPVPYIAAPTTLLPSGPWLMDSPLAYQPPGDTTTPTSQTFQQALTADPVVATSTMQRQVNKNLSASASAAAASMQRQPAKTLTTSSPAIATFQKQVNKPLAATSGAIATMLQTLVRTITLSASSGSVAIFQRQTNKKVVATGGASATMQRQISKVLSASSAAIATLGRGLVKLQSLTATSGSVATMLRRQPVSLNAAGGSTATIQRQTNKNLTTSAGSTATLQKQANKTLTATASGSVATLARLLVKLLTMAAASGAVASLRRQVNKPLTTSSSAATTIQKQVAKNMPASSGSTATLGRARIISRAMSAASAGLGTLGRLVNKPLTAVSPSSATQQRRVSKVLGALSSAIAQLLRVFIPLIPPVLGGRVDLSDAIARSVLINEATAFRADLSDTVARRTDVADVAVARIALDDTLVRRVDLSDHE